MKLSHDELIKIFYEQIKDEYPDFTFEQVEEICKAPFIYFKKRISEGFDLPIIQLKYLGTLTTTTGRIRSMIHSIRRHYAKGKITTVEYEEKDKFLRQRLKDLIAYIRFRKERKRGLHKDVGGQGLEAFHAMMVDGLIDDIEIDNFINNELINYEDEGDDNETD